MATSTDSPNGNIDLLRVGKSALSLLEMREEAAKLGAAKLELQQILAEAESGSSEKLRDWLLKHRDIAGLESLIATLEPISSNGNSKLRLDIPQIQTVSAARNQLSVAEPSIALVAEDNAEASEPENGWEDLLHASRKRQASEEPNLPAPVALQEVAPKPSEQLAKSADKKQHSLANAPIASKATPIKPEVLQSSTSPRTVKKVKFDIRSAMTSEEDDVDKRAFRWLSGSVGVSLMVHLILTISLGLAVITISQPTEPIRITSSSYEETATLEAPVELEQIEELEVTEVSTQAISQTVSTSVSEAASTMVVSDSAIGSISAPPSSSVGSTLSQATGAGGGKGDMMGAVQFFGVGASGNTFAFLVDNSGSIRADGVFEMAKMELMKAVRALKPTQRFFVAFFGEELQVMQLDGTGPSDYPVYATPENIANLERWVVDVKIQTGRHPLDALELAIEKDPDAIFLMFDGATSIDVPAKVARFNRVTDLISGERPKVPINTIRFPPSKADSADEPKLDAMMKKLAQENGGTYRYVPKPNKR